MSSSTAIGMVSRSLVNLLQNEMSLNSGGSTGPGSGGNTGTDIRITVLAPDESGEVRRVNLFLYKIEEDPFLKNQDWQAKKGDPQRMTPPPLSLKLFYLMTAYAQNDPVSGNSNAHEILGDAMRAFYQNSIVPRKYLDLGLQEAQENIKITLNSHLNMDELSKVWSTFTKPYRLSVLYEVSLVQIDMLSAKERAMPIRVREIGVPEIKTPFAPPVVTNMSPSLTSSGGTVTFAGENLSGWKAYVTINGKKIVDGEDLSSNAFTATIPDGFLPGAYQIEVNISDLFKRVFPVDVEPLL